MRTITDHKVTELNDLTRITAIDEPGPGGANHIYKLEIPSDTSGLEPLTIQFQNGGIKDVGTNGYSGEALIAIALDRIRSFQAGPFACRENAIALTHLETALLWLGKRTADRKARGVEGTLQK